MPSRAFWDSSWFSWPLNVPHVKVPQIISDEYGETPPLITAIDYMLLSPPFVIVVPSLGKLKKHESRTTQVMNQWTGCCAWVACVRSPDAPAGPAKPADAGRL